ncbi:hypothetical protein [Microbacterium album]|uniref:Uncharacterized protein n=1 Tax=Microbacterium album TaxID=2053191 RepID=A0A917MNA6_9MICO|nr:hypothetical protein [Microbacterium album]GGH50428.1 hypothetical protein GCM10010921_29180 [Microbacterium album]
MDSRDRGSVLVPVIGIAAIVLVLALLVASLTVSSLRTTQSTRASVQASAAAEAGIAWGVANFHGGELCGNGIRSADLRDEDPAFVIEISFSTSATIEEAVASPEGWRSDTCPGAASGANFVRLTSTGFGGYGDSSRTVEAIYEYTSETTDPPRNPIFSGAIFAGTALNLEGGNLIRGDMAADVYVNITTGTTLKCQGSSAIDGSLMVTTGNLELQSCTVRGDVGAGGTVLVQNPSRVEGNVYSLANPGTSVTVSNGTTIGGTILARGGLKSQGRSDAAALDELVSQNVLTSGGRASARLNDLTVALPVAPTWPEMSMNSPDLAALGYDVVVLRSDQCRPANGNGLRELYEAHFGRSMKTVIDARACSKLDMEGSDLTLRLNADVIVLTPANVAMSRTVFESASGADHDLWFVHNDANREDAKPTCGHNGTFEIKDGARVRERISALIYSPCSIVQNNGSEWRGQLVGGNVTVQSGHSVLVSEDVGLGAGDGSDSGQSETSPETGTGGVLGNAPLVYRDVR